MAVLYTNLEGAFFRQRNAFTEWDWLTCTGVGDISQALAEQSPDYCLDPAQSGQLIPAGFIPGDPGTGSYSLEKPLTVIYNALLQDLDDEWMGRVNWTGAGARDNVRNYEVAYLMIPCRPNNPTITNPVRGITGSSSRVTTNLAMTFLVGHTLYPVQFTRQTVSNLAAANDVYFLPKKLQTRLSVYKDLLQYGAIAMDRAAGYIYDSEVKLTLDYGNNWAASAVDPFTWGAHALDIIMFEQQSGYRILTVRDAVVGAPPEAAYSDDGGASWVNRAMSTIYNSIGGRAMTMVGSKIIVVCSGGYIFYSTDQGDSWAVLDAASETTQDLNDITQHDRDYVYAVGNSNAFIRSSDGGVSVGSVTGPAPGVNLLSVACNRNGFVFVGTNDGRIFRSADRGTTWTEMLDFGGGTIPWIQFDPKTLWTAYAIYNTATPVGKVYRTEDGGLTWYLVPNFPTNSGLNGGHVADPNNCVVVGEANGGTTFIAKSAPY